VSQATHPCALVLKPTVRGHGYDSLVQALVADVTCQSATYTPSSPAHADTSSPPRDPGGAYLVCHNRLVLDRGSVPVEEVKALVGKALGPPRGIFLRVTLRNRKR
jgi:hypothetical protein